MWKGYDMTTWGDYRYNMFQRRGIGSPVLRRRPSRVSRHSRIPEGIPVIDMLQAVHEKFYKPKE